MVNRILFCIHTGAVGGGNKVILQFASGLKQDGHTVHFMIWQDPVHTEWFSQEFTQRSPRSLDGVGSDYDLIFVSHAYLALCLMPYAAGTRMALICQGLENSCIATTLDAVDERSHALDRVMSWPSLSIVVTSESLRETIMSTLGRTPVTVSLGVDEAFFAESSKPRGGSARILMVGDYLQPIKGMNQAFAAIGRLAEKQPAELVLITQQASRADILRGLAFPVEVHCNPPQENVPAVFASCDAYLCSSWYEGFGLATLEAFAAGLPVVSTNHSGVKNYGRENENILLCPVGDSEKMYLGLKKVLTDSNFREALQVNAAKTASTFRWSDAKRKFAMCTMELAKSKPLDSMPEAMIGELLSGLELDGLYHPPCQWQLLGDLSASIVTVVRRLMQQPTQAELWEELEQIQAALQEQLPGEKSQYFETFQSKISLCKLLLALKSDENLPVVLSCLSREDIA